MDEFGEGRYSQVDGPYGFGYISSFISRAAYAVWGSGAACIAVASFAYSVAAALVRPLSPEIGVFEIVAVRSSISVIFSYIAFRVSGQTSPFFGQRRHMPFLAMRGLIGASAMDCYYATIQRLPLGDAVSLLFCNPVLTALLAWLLLHEPMTWRGLLGCFVSLCGMVLVVRPPFLFGDDASSRPDESSSKESLSEWSSRRASGVVFGLGSACLAAAAYLTIRVIGKKETPLSIAVWFHVSAMVHSWILLSVGWPRPAVWPKLLDWTCLLGIAMMSFTANVLLNRGFQIESAALASGVNMSQVLYSHLIGVLILHEKAYWLGIVGAVGIAGGVFAVAVDSKRAAKSKAAKTAAENEFVEMQGIGEDLAEEESYDDNEGASLLGNTRNGITNGVAKEASFSDWREVEREELGSMRSDAPPPGFFALQPLAAEGPLLGGNKRSQDDIQ